MDNSEFAQSSAAERELLPPERKGSGVWPWMFALIAIAAALWARTMWRPADDEPRGEKHPAVGTPLSKFELAPLTAGAQPATLADLQGRVTLVNFWGPWCPACVVEFPHLMEIEEHFRGQDGFQFFSISTNQDAFDESGLAESTTEFLKRHRAEFPAHRDPQAVTTRALIGDLELEGFGYPTTAVIDRHGALVALWTGYAPGDEKAVRRAVEKALREPKAEGQKSPVE